MKNYRIYKVAFQIRRVGEYSPTRILHEISIDNDLSSEEIDSEINWYYKYDILNVISSIAETYPYTIVSISDCSQNSQTEMLNEFYRLSKNKQLKILLSIMRKRFNSQHEYYNLIASYINFKYDTVKKCYIKINT